MLSITSCALLVRGNPLSVDNTVLIVTGTSTAGLNSTAQVRLTLAPAITTSGAVSELRRSEKSVDSVS